MQQNACVYFFHFPVYLPAVSAYVDENRTINNKIQKAMTTDYIMQYIPVRYSVTPQQASERKEVWNFKDGSCSLRIKNELVRRINAKVGSEKSQWVVLFVPGSTAEKTSRRYSTIASYIQSMTGVTATMTGISNAYDRAERRYDKSGDPTESFAINSSAFHGKKVILIDDVTTTGKSFNRCASKIMNAGAKDVHGLFIAKTFNPDWNCCYCA